MADEMIDVEARAALREHNAVCTERYGNLWAAVERIEKSLAEANTQAHGRFNTISNRMWTLAVSSLGATVLGLAGVIFWLVTQKAGR